MKLLVRIFSGTYCLIFMVLFMGCDQDSNMTAHTGIVKSIGHYEFEYDTMLRVTHIDDVENYNWASVEIGYIDDQVASMVIWLDIDQILNITYQYDGGVLSRSSNAPIDALEVLTIATYPNVIDDRPMVALDSIFVRGDSKWVFENLAERNFEYDLDGNLLSIKTINGTEEQTEDFTYDNLLNPFEGQPFVFRSSLSPIPVLKAGPNNLSGYYGQPDDKGYPQVFIEYGNTIPIEYFNTLSEVAK